MENNCIVKKCDTSPEHTLEFEGLRVCVCGEHAVDVRFLMDSLARQVFASKSSHFRRMQEVGEGGEDDE